MLVGIDEAGRGSVIGPMIIAGVLVEDEEYLKELNVRDSKEIDSEKREELYEKITEVVKDYVVIKIPANEIDELRKRFSLNVIEAKKMAEIINILKPKKAFVDCPQTSTEKFELLLKSMIELEDIEIIAENFADKKYPVVSAASIIAKVERDREVEKIKNMIGEDIGVGYPHDERTIRYLKKIAPDFPDFVRKSWITVQDLINQKKQKNLKDF